MLFRSWHPGQKAGEVASKDVSLAANDNLDIELKINLRKVREQRKPGAADEKEY